jgi:hypothetical protein
VVATASSTLAVSTYGLAQFDTSSEGENAWFTEYLTETAA